MRNQFLFIAGAFLLTIYLTGCSEKKTPADLIIRGGTIYTVEEGNPVVEAVAVSGDKIVFAGDLKDVSKYEGENTRIIDLQGKTMTPGFIEGHGHFMGLGYNELNLDLMSVTSYEELVEKVKEAVAKAQPGQWIVGRGWHQDKWTTKPEIMFKGFQTHQLLSSVSPNNPVFLRHASGHAGFANAKAMQIAGVNQLSVEKLDKDLGEGGEIILDNLGNPTGIFNERAQGLIAQHIPESTEETDSQALQLAIAASLRNGITSFHDAGVSRENLQLFRKFKNENKLNTRLYVMLTGFDSELIYEWFKKGPEIDSSNLLTIRAIKLNCDGALGSRGAWLLEPYTDRPDFSGMATLSMDTVMKISREGLKYGFQVCSHAIGDRANKEILDRYEIAFKDNPEVKDHRFRIEHAQHLQPTDIPRFGKLGVIPAMQAIHLSSDRPWAIDRLGEKRIKEGAYMWQSLLKSGAKIVNGTDVPVEPINPIASFFASVTRQTLAGEPKGGYEPEEKMTRVQALRSYTLDAAYGAF
ncbi:MAG TPA: amidohydrolase, partial [Cyclobacteriaceae bacterium]|nr:amidohydrolase [Cyclobacteriaceae bacterium]